LWPRFFGSSRSMFDVPDCSEREGLCVCWWARLPPASSVVDNTDRERERLRVPCAGPSGTGKLACVKPGTRGGAVNSVTWVSADSCEFSGVAGTNFTPGCTGASGCGAGGEGGAGSRWGGGVSAGGVCAGSCVAARGGVGAQGGDATGVPHGVPPTYESGDSAGASTCADSSARGNSSPCAGTSTCADSLFCAGASVSTEGGADAKR
jgi:hypothetical protein